ncbi:MAG TPA: amino acid ABC transporter substrate-binding protein [Accumulibacter sp.]|nr:amino acid ABC transporter substrate-binding protein [Accumulibacter sp.]
MRLKRYWAILAGSLLLSFAGSLLAADTLDKIKSRKSISFGYRELAIPYSYVGEDNQPTGYSVDVCLKVAAALIRQLGIDELQLQWVPVTSETRIGKLKSGQIDIECGSTTSSLSRMEEVDFSLPIAVEGLTYLSRRSSALKRLENMNGKRVAVVLGSPAERQFSEALARQRLSAVELVRFSDPRQAMGALFKGRAEAYVADRSSLVALALESPSPGAWQLGDESFTQEPVALMVRRNDANFRLVVNREIARLARTREIFVIYDRWFGFLSPPSPLLESLYQLNVLPE